MNSKPETRLPGEKDDHVVEVSLKHVVIAFSTLIISGVLVSASVILLRDHIKYRRQNIFISSLKELLSSINLRKENPIESGSE